MDKEKLLYILEHMDYDICKLVDNVITDSRIDPHYSAVNATNLIKCYIQVMKDIGKDLSFDTVEGYLKNTHSFTNEEIIEFENLRKIESEYYEGEQF